MAEYYPLISRAVSGLRTGTPDSRKIIYERARGALIGQLRAMQPPVPEDDIVRETAALDEAIARVEADVANQPAKPAETTSVRTIPQAAPVEPAAVPVRPELAKPSAGPVPPVAVSGDPSPVVTTAQAGPIPASKPATPVQAAPAVNPPKPLAPRPERPTLAPRAAISPVRTPMPARPPAPALVRPPTPTTPASGSVDAQPPAEPKIATPPSVEGPTSGPILPAAPTLAIPSDPKPESAPGQSPLLSADPLDFERSMDAALANEPERPAVVPSRDEVARPVAPRPVESRKPNLRVWIVTAAALVAVVAIAFAAWKLRDRPEELVKAPVAVQTSEPVVGKIAERADGDAGSTGQDTSPATSTNDGTSQPVSSTSNASQSAAQPSTTADQGVPVAYKAAILVDASDEPQKVKTYVGTVVWRIESVSQGQDQPLGTSIRADIDIPDAKAQVVVQIRKNTEAQFPASHTIDIKFTIAADSPLGGIKQINVPQMRREDMPTGDPLAGVPVTITDNYFLVGLTRGPVEQRNLDLLQSRGWIDIPMLLSNGKASKLTFEKGAGGDRVFNEALQAWK